MARGLLHGIIYRRAMTTPAMRAEEAGGPRAAPPAPTVRRTPTAEPSAADRAVAERHEQEDFELALVISASLAEQEQRDRLAAAARGGGGNGGNDGNGDNGGNGGNGGNPAVPVGVPSATPVVGVPWVVGNLVTPIVDVASESWRNISEWGTQRSASLSPGDTDTEMLSVQSSTSYSSTS